jgi:hypothetical protein
MQLQSYWGVEIAGGRQNNSTPLSFATGASTDPSLNVYGTVAANPVSVVTGASGQIGNLQEWRNSGAGLLSVVNSSGSFGIGTSTPFYALTVASTTGPQLALSAGAGLAEWTLRNAGGNFYLSTTTVQGTATTTLPALTILNSNGYVGVGATAPRTALDLVANANNAGILSLQNTNSGGYSAADVYDSAGTKQAGFGWGNSGVTATFANSYYFNTNNSNPIIFLTNSTERMRIGGTGNIGIGTTTPASTLSVQGNGLISGNLSVAGLTATGTITFTGLTGTQCLHEVNGVVSGTGSDCGSGGSNSFSYLFPNNATTTPLTFASSTNAGTFLSGNYISTSTTATSSFLGAVSVGSTTPGGSSLFSVGTSTPSLTVNKNTGFIGIGTSNPVAALDVNGLINVPGNQPAGTYGISFANRSDFGLFNNTFDYSLKLLTPGGINFTSGASSDMNFVTGTNERMRITSGGNVGIGTTSPYATLSVVGASGVVADHYAATSTTATSTFAGGLNVGDSGLVYDFSTGITSIASARIGSMSFDTDAGLVSWTDLPVSSATAGTAEGYTAFLAGNPAISVYGTSTGSGNVGPIFVGIGTSTPTATLSVQGNGYISSGLFVGGNIISTSTTASVFPYASTTMITAVTASTTNLTVSSIKGVTQCLHADAQGNISGTGSDCGSGGGSFAYLFPNNATTTPLTFASSTNAGRFISGTFLATTTSASVFPYASTTAITSTGNAYLATDAAAQVGIGSTSPASIAKLFIDGSTSASGAASAVAGIHEILTFNPSTSNTTQVGNRLVLQNAPTSATNTAVANLIRVIDSSNLSNLVRGMEIVANAGNNTWGVNTGLRATGNTFGVQGITTGLAGGTSTPAAIYGENTGTTQGDVLRLYSSSMTSAPSMATFYQESSAFSGNGLTMNFGKSLGSFTGNFLSLQVNDAARFVVSAGGTTTIGQTGQTATQAGLQIGNGGICVDNDGTCTASTSGRITAVQYNTANSDLAERYYSDESLSTGDIVSTKGKYFIGSAGSTNDSVIGVVSTKPGIVLGDGEAPLSDLPSYPIALAGRVPVKISDQNGPIHKGDRIILSDIPGVGMREGTTSGVVVGIALEDFNSTDNYLSDGTVEVETTKVPGAKVCTTKTVVSDGKQSGGSDSENGTGTSSTAGVSTTEQDCVTADSVTSVPTNTPSITAFASGKAVKTGKILLFVNLGRNNFASAAQTSSAVTVSTESSTPTTTTSSQIATTSITIQTDSARIDSLETRTTSLEGQIAGVNAAIESVGTAISAEVSSSTAAAASSTMQVVTGWLTSLGASIENGVARFVAIVTDSITAKIAYIDVLQANVVRAKALEVGDAADAGRSGVTIYDRGTGQAVCMFIMNGQMMTSAGACLANATTTAAAAAAVTAPVFTQPTQPVITNPTPAPATPTVTISTSTATTTSVTATTTETTTATSTPVVTSTSTPVITATSTPSTTSTTTTSVTATSTPASSATSSPATTTSTSTSSTTTASTSTPVITTTTEPAPTTTPVITTTTSDATATTTP